jgi:hypothetical protein
LRTDINEAKPIVPGSRGGYGLLQWTGPRRRQLEAFAAQRGTPVSDMGTQVDFLVNELNTTEKRAASRIMGTNNSADAAVAIMNDFLRPHKDHRPKREKRYREMFSGGGGSDVLAGGEGSDRAEEIRAEIARRKRKKEIETEIHRRKVAAEGPDPRDRADVEAALAEAGVAEEKGAWDTFMDGVRAVRGVTGPMADRMTDTGTLGLIGDEFEAFLNATFKGEEGKTWKQEFDEFREARRARDDKFEEENPNLALTADIAGGAALGGALKGPVIAAEGMGAKMAVGAGEGAVAGGVMGFNQGRGGAEERLQDGGEGLVGGALIGGALPPVAAAGGAIARGVGNVIGVGSPERKAAELITGALDGAPQGAVANKPDTILDLGGENMRRLAQTAHSVPTKGGEAMGEFLEDRVAKQGDRIASDASEYLGQTGSQYFRTVQDVISARSKQAAPLYNRLSQQSASVDGALASLIERPAMQKALKSASQSIENGTGVKVDLSAERLPFRVLDQAKKELDGLIRWGKTPDGAAKGADVAQLKQLQKSFIKTLDSKFPGYAKARATFADGAAIEDAMSQGREFMKGDADEMFEAFQSLGKSEQDAFRLGVARQLQDIVGKTPDGADAARKLINNEFVRDRLQMVTRGHGAFRKFLHQLQRESGYAQARNDVLKGSQTQARQTAADMALATGEAVATGTAPGVLRALKNAVIARGKGINKPTADRIARLMVDEDVPKVMAFLKSHAGRKFVKKVGGHLEPSDQIALIRASAGLGGESVGEALIPQ